MRRRKFLALVGSAAAAWSLVARAQPAAIPVIGFLSFRSANESATSVAAFREGLSEIGYVEGRSVHMAFRWAEGHKDRLPVLAAELVDNLRVAVIAAVAEALRRLQPRRRPKPFQLSSRMALTRKKPGSSPV